MQLEIIKQIPFHGNIDKGEIVGAIFFVLKKAFDVVDPEILVRKLLCYKLDLFLISWIRSYLSNRKQCIAENNLKSATEKVKIRCSTTFCLRTYPISIIY